MLTVFKVNNKNTRTMSCCIYFLTLNACSRFFFFFIVNFEHVSVSLAEDKIHKTTQVDIKQ